jgi:hypothetical protein
LSQTLIKTFVINGQSVDVGSDWHYPLSDASTPAKIVAHVKRVQGSRVLFCLGDLFDTPDGQDSTAPINETVSAFAKLYDQVVFTPGNHDLRGRNEPWDSFRFPDNVVWPRTVDPVAVTIGSNRLLVANLFYDLGFIDPAVIGSSAQTIRKFYAKSNDGRHFLGGDTARFSAMTVETARALTPEVDILVTHALPHPSLVTFRIPEVTAETTRLQSELGIPFICDPADDQKMAEEYKRRGAKGEVTPADVRAFWNNKSIVMGSNVLGHPRAGFRDGLTMMHGHHHRIDLKPRRIAGKTVDVVTHQPNPWNPESSVAL